MTGTNTVASTGGGRTIVVSEDVVAAIVEEPIDVGWAVDGLTVDVC